VWLQRTAGRGVLPFWRLFLPKLRQPFALPHYLGFATALYSRDFFSLGVASDLQ
jgi:hypothetical protein